MEKPFFRENPSVFLLTNNIIILSWNQKWKYDSSQYLYFEDKQNNQPCNPEFVFPWFVSLKIIFF